MLNFDFLEKVLGIVSLPHFVYDFSRKLFLIIYSVKWPNFNAWLPLLLEIMCIAIAFVTRLWWWWWRIVFVVWSTDERRFALFQAGIWTGFEPAQNLSSGFVEWSYAVVVTTTPRRHKRHKFWRHRFWN